MPPIVFWSLLYWAVMLGIGILIAVKVTKFKWFLWWVVSCIILYGVWMALFPPKKTWGDDEDIINSTSKFADTMTFKTVGGDYDTLPIITDTITGIYPYLFDRGINPPYLDSTNRFTIWTTPIPKPRKDTVDWKKWFRENTEPLDFDTAGKKFSKVEFSLFVMAVIDDRDGKHKFIEPLKIDGDGKMVVTDSLLAIQELIKNMLITSKYHSEQLKKYDSIIEKAETTTNMILNEAVRQGKL